MRDPVEGGLVKERWLIALVAVASGLISSESMNDLLTGEAERERDRNDNWGRNCCWACSSRSVSFFAGYTLVGDTASCSGATNDASYSERARTREERGRAHAQRW
jgi:hypothetical protein